MDALIHNLELKKAAGGVLLSAAIFLTACAEPSAEPANLATEVEIVVVTSTPTETISPTDTSQPTDAPSATLTPRPTNTQPSTSIPTATQTATSIPSSTLTAAPPTQTPTKIVTADKIVDRQMAVTQDNSAAKLEVYETTITLPTYPYQEYLIEVFDPVYNMSVLYFNRPTYEQTNPTPEPVDYTAVVIENPYLRLTFLPELGGRLYSAVVKATNQEIFYQNEVVKPSRYGVLQPYEANWWLATGGMEWAYPTQEHGHRWGVPWTYRIEESDEAVTIILSDLGDNRVSVDVAVTLQVDSPIFEVAPKLVNNGPNTIPVQFWLNAALALSSNSMSRRTQFIVPSDEIEVHSRGEEGWLMPEAQLMTDWPEIDGRDLSDYRQWQNYFGFFVPEPDLSFMAAYNPDTDLGVVRLIEPDTLGNKLFAFSTQFDDRSYTDNNAQYFEIWGGVNRGFWPEADIQVAPGEVIEWQERWWPVAEVNGITWANEQAAIGVQRIADTIELSAILAQQRQGEVIVSADEEILLSKTFTTEPAMPLRWEFRANDVPLDIQLLDEQGQILLQYCVGCS